MVYRTTFELEKGEKMGELGNENYVSRFLRYKCAGDIMNVVSPMHKPQKEISESFSILRKIKPLTLVEKMKYNVLDLCAGNALTSIMSVFILPVTYALALDKKRKVRDYSMIKRFNYLEEDIYSDFVKRYLDSPDSFLKESEMNTIIIASHPCKHAVRIIELFNNSKAKALCIIPCCNGSFDSLQGAGFLTSKMSKYDVWTYYLSSLVKDSKVSVTTDHNIWSPKNNVIWAVRDGNV